MVCSSASPIRRLTEPSIVYGCHRGFGANSINIRIALGEPFPENSLISLQKIKYLCKKISYI